MIKAVQTTVACSRCGHSNPSGASTCAKCNARIPHLSDSAPTAQDSAPTIQPNSQDETPGLPPGTVLAERYEIIQTLGTGGMGAVYKVFDRRLTRVVALKTIHPQLATAPLMMKRFKQEVLLAQKITHKNVVRIFDIGEDQRTKFITMDFIEGVNLKQVVLERGKFSPKEAIAIIRQVCLALDAAHVEGVVHRDLKPQNIMIDKDQQVVVMDFGIARSADSAGATQTGALLGTPDYMSPEQARMEEADARSDIFSLGLILYELLTGELAFKGDTVVEAMFKRIKERATPPAEIDHNIPKGANDIVVKCLEPERERRYQNVHEILEDLEGFDPSKKVGAAAHVKARLRKASRHRNVTVGFVAVLLLIVAGLALRNRFVLKPAADHPPLMVLVADFSNATGDDVFTGTLESMSTTALEEASFVNIYNRSQARTVLGTLQKGATKLDEPAARLVAMREGISVIVAGSIARENAGYQISIRAVDAATGKSIATKEIDAANNRAVLGSVGRLVAPIRTALGDTTPESAQVAAAEAYTAGSLEAAHAYAVGKENEGAGKYPEAIRNYLQAVELDPYLGRAYVGLAVMHVNQKKQAEAGEYYKKALALVDRMSEHEKYRTLGTYYLSVGGNYDQGIEALRKLVFLYPADATAYNNLSIGYARVGKMAESVDASRHAIELTPGNLQRRYNYAVHLMYAGDFITAVTEAERVLQQNPRYEIAYLPVALSALLRGDVGKAAETYSRLEKISPGGASMSKMGRADLELYTGRYQSAVGILLAGIAADEKERNSEELAHKLVALAEAYLALGRKTDAAAAAAKAAQASTNDGIHFLAARALVEAGEDAKAQQLATELEGRLQKQTKSLALMITGDIAVKRNRPSEAVDAYREAQKLNDTWISHLLLGEAYVQVSHFPEALQELEASEKRAGEATDLFGIATTTLRYLPPLYYWLGRTQEGLGASDAARKSYLHFLAIRQNADPVDKLFADAKHRAGQ